MKKLLFLLLILPFLGNSQATFTAPVGYNTGAPTATPSGVGTRWRFDLLTGKKYTWLPGSLSWDEDARGIDQVAGCSAPLYTPGYNQSTFAVNSCTVPELYQWTGAAWVQLNEGAVYAAGTGISIDGSNVISNTAPNVVQELSIDGQDLTLSNGGGTVAIPAGADGNGIYGGSGTIPNGTNAKIAAAGAFQLQYSNGQSGLTLNDNAGGAITVSSPGSDSYIEISPSALTLGTTIGGFVFDIDNETIVLTGPQIGWQYDGEYHDIADNPTSIPYVKMFSDGLIPYAPVSYTSAAAPNNCIFYSTTLSKLAYKDPGGTVNPLY